MIKTNKICKRLRRQAGGVQILRITSGGNHTVSLDFTCDATTPQQACTQITNYFLNEGINDAIKMLDECKNDFYEMWIDDEDFESEADLYFKNANGLTLDDVLNMSSSELASSLTDFYWKECLFVDGDNLEYDNEKGCWTFEGSGY